VVVLATMALVAFAYSLVASRIEATPLTGPILFTAFGLATGPIGLGVLDLDVQAATLEWLAELTLALVLFTDAARADLGTLRRSLGVPERLLLVGLPLAIVFGTLAGVLLLPGLDALHLALLATMLAPTDAALGKPVITHEAVPPSVREGLNVESGLNDGICVPVLFVFLALAAGQAEGGTAGLAMRLVVEELGIGLAVGVVLALAGAAALRGVMSRRWIRSEWAPVPMVALALATFAVAQSAGGSGFVAAFSGGLVLGARTRTHKDELLQAAAGAGNTLALVTWVLFGAAVVGPAWAHFTWAPLVYALLSLTAVRMGAVWLALLGSGLRTETRLFLGWFGPRGLASIVFVIIALEDLPLQGPLALAVTCTVVGSILAHGLTAEPLARVYGRRVAGAP